ncbi:sugar kinase [Oceanibaculum pacificum]|uniref:2-dehydro-3-deoxygluconokinase n=1 Tax=Oceanibaculum pacificum TaxID=580166 RepID=A0A154W1F0_9PROT|nr:sugar kinase [Oceanibaculum pacificum]KZD07281.1 ketodeoxygluconokinase [Oceanibaculum pacificum]
MATPIRVASIGECMVELRDRSEGLSRSFGGDTLNTAVYLSRLGVEVGYLTALGDDPYSAEMLAAWRAEGVGVDDVATLPGRLPGLYAIKTDKAGERSFFYWRSAAAARDMLKGEAGDRIEAAILASGLTYLSGITLSILDADSRDRLNAALDRLRDTGGRVVFDGNYRPRNWPDQPTARKAVEAVLARVDIALPTYEDEQALFGDASPADTIERISGFGVGEIAVKCGQKPALVAAGARQWVVAPRPVSDVVDTTAAGDAFNAGYLAARLSGETPDAAAARGHEMAGAVIRHPGAIIPRDAMPRLG